MTRTQFTDPWHPPIRTFAMGAASLGSNAWNTANKAVYVPCYFPEACQVTALAVRGNGGTANYDIGLYNADYTKIQSKGPTTHVDADEVLTLSVALDVPAGTLYYAGYVLSATAGFVVSQALTAPVADRLGCMEQASAGTLPSPMVPALITVANIPAFKFRINGLPT